MRNLLRTITRALGRRLAQPANRRYRERPVIRRLFQELAVLDATRIERDRQKEEKARRVRDHPPKRS